VHQHFALVDDNKDPDGRLRLFFPQWGDNVVTGWVLFDRACATWTQKIGIPIPDESGILNFYHPKAKAMAEQNPNMIKE